MDWLKKNWSWVLVNGVALLPLVGVLVLFKIDLFGSGPLITIDLPARMLEARSAGEGLLPAKSPLWFPIHSTGEWAIRWLVVSLTITPLMILFGFKRLRRYRKLFGLYAFGYSALHFLFFIADKSLWHVFDEYNYIIGLICFFILVLLAITSNKWSIRVLQRKWKSLHKWAYAAGVLAIMHLLLLEKDSWIVYTVVLGVGFLTRFYSARRLGLRSAPNIGDLL